MEKFLDFIEYDDLWILDFFGNWNQVFRTDFGFDTMKKNKNGISIEDLQRCIRHLFI